MTDKEKLIADISVFIDKYYARIADEWGNEDGFDCDSDE